MDDTTRRWFLGATAAVTMYGLSGCAGGPGTADGTTATTETDGGMETTGTEGTTETTGTGGGMEPIPGSEYPAIGEWLTETEVGGADDTFDGTLVDMRGQDTVEIQVGAEGNDGFFAFAPSAVVVSQGTTVTWEWTGEGGAHNVEAEPDEQIDRSDYEFSSGEATGGTGTEFTRTMDALGVALYHCEPHLSLGMKGGIGVE